MVLRKMTTADIPDAIRICRISMHEDYRPEVFSYFMMQWSDGQLVDADLFGHINGFICGTRLGGGKVSIALFAVDPLHRRNGRGSALISEFRRHSMLAGERMVQLEVRAENQNAIKFYESRGFMRTEIMRSFYNDGGDAIRMIAPILSNV